MTKLTQAPQAKIPPYSVEAEQCIIGGLMLDNSMWDKVADCVVSSEFYRKDHQMLFNAIAELAKKSKPFDVLTIAEHLKQSLQLEACGGEVYLYELAQNTPSAANVKAYADIVHEKAMLRQLISASGTIADLSYFPEGRDSSQILDESERIIFQISDKGQRGDGPIGITELLTQATEKIDKLYHQEGGFSGLESGYSDLDRITSGFQPADLIIVAARPSMGKTSFSMNIAEHVAISQDKPVLVFSMEMPGDSLAMRMMSSLGRINQSTIRSGKLEDEDWPRLTSAVTMLSQAKLFIDDTPALSPTEIRARTRRIAREHGDLALIVVDYLQLMQVPGMKENRTQEISEISRSLKSLAKEMNVPVIALSQLNRSLEQRTDKRPVMSDLRESGAIEQDADLITFIYRDEVYNPESPDKGVAEILIRKHRNGALGKVNLAFLGQYTRFENLANEQSFEAYQ